MSSDRLEKDWRKLCEEDCRKFRRIQHASKSSIVVTLPQCLQTLGLKPGRYVKVIIEDIKFDENTKDIKEILLRIVVIE